MVAVAVIGTYALKGDWIEVHCDPMPRGYGRLALERVDPGGERVVRIEREFPRHAWALRAAEMAVLCHGGQLGQHANAVAGGRVDPCLARRMFAAREAARWVHVDGDGGGRW